MAAVDAASAPPPAAPPAAAEADDAAAHRVWAGQLTAIIDGLAPQVVEFEYQWLPKVRRPYLTLRPLGAGAPQEVLTIR
jgi:hypothetical protein